MSEKKYYWSPGIFWSLTGEGRLQIENTVFEDDVADLFPEFYFLTGKGAALAEIEQKFTQYPKRKLKKFINLLIKEQVLNDEIQGIDGVFYHQSTPYEQYDRFDETIKFDEEKLNAFVEQQLTRSKKLSGKRIRLAQVDGLGEHTRRSVRKFNENIQIPFEKFSGMLEVLKQEKIEGKRRYQYPSAGGLYPTDCYIYVKNGRVEGVDAGLYYYDPAAGEIERVSTEVFPAEAHYFTNQNINRSSACSIFFIYHGDANLPKYGDRAYFYGIVDAGIVSEALTERIEKMGMASCIIGEMDFAQIEPHFYLEANERFLFSMEVGIK